MGANSGQPLGRPQFRKAHFQKTWASQETTNDYVTLGTVLDKTGFTKCTLQIYNTGDTNDISYKIEGSLDGTNYNISIMGVTVLQESDYDVIDISSLLDDCYVPYIKILVESTVDDNHSDVEAFAVCV